MYNEFGLHNCFRGTFHLKKNNFLNSLPFLILLISQIVLLIVFDLTNNINYIDNDMGMGLYHFSEMVKNHTINLQGYTNTTTLEIDTSFILAAPIYLITNNLSLSVGISNLFIIALYFIVIYGILSELKVKNCYKLFTLILVFTPYSIGMLDYLNMMFLGLSCYSIKAIVPLMAFWILLIKENKKITYWIVLAVYLLLLFITTLSTGVYSMFSGILPIIVFNIIKMWNNNSLDWIKNRRNLIWFITTAIAFVAGYFKYNQYYTEFSRSNTLLNKSDLFIDNTLSYIKGFFLLFGAIPDKEVKMLSPLGISYLVKVILVFAMIFVAIKTIKFLPLGFTPMQLLSFIFWWNAFVIFVSQTRVSTDTGIHYRYLILGALPLIILLGKSISDWSLTWKKVQEYIAILVLFFLLAAMQYGCSKNVFTYFDTQNAYLKEITAYIDTLDVKSVIWVNDTEYLNMCKGLDDNHIWGCWDSEAQSLYSGTNCYNSASEGDFYDKESPSAFICYVYTTPADYLPEEIASHYTYAGSIEYFEIYTSEGFYIK